MCVCVCLRSCMRVCRFRLRLRLRPPHPLPLLFLFLFFSISCSSHSSSASASSSSASCSSLLCACASLLLLQKGHCSVVVDCRAWNTLYAETSQQGFAFFETPCQQDRRAPNKPSDSKSACHVQWSCNKQAQPCTDRCARISHCISECALGLASCRGSIIACDCFFLIACDCFLSNRL